MAEPLEIDWELLEHMTEAERKEFDALLRDDPALWRPLKGPQTEAAISEADIIGYGGAAGGGKTDLGIGLALTEHRKVGVFRDTGTELTAIVDRVGEILGNRKGYNGQDRIWRFKRPTDGVHVQIEFGSYPNPGDETKYQGRPHDLLHFDEASNHRESQVRFLLGWLRSTSVGQRKRALLTFNPPTTVEGRWIIAFFAPWLDDKHPNPAVAGELRWFATVKGVDLEVPDGRPFVLADDGVTRIYDFDRDEYDEDEIVEPMSRTFIPSRIADNPFLASTGYMRTLQALPEPLRSQMLKGDFRAGMKDDAFQVIPTAWVEAAMERWEKPKVMPAMDSIGMDVSKGGGDETVILPRHGWWFGQLTCLEGPEVPDGATAASQCVAVLRDGAVIHVDAFGAGSDCYAFLSGLGLQVIGVQFGDPATATDSTGRLLFFNLRSQLWWAMREALNPRAAEKTGIALPPDRKLLADLCAPKWSLPHQRVKVQGRDELVLTLGRSPDRGTAAILALMDTPKRQVLADVLGRNRARRAEYNPIAEMEREQER